MKELYAIDKKGKIRVFQVDIVLAGPSQPNTAYIKSATGLLGGELAVKTTTVAQGKQGRSVNEQAQFQADALYLEKVDEGYKSLHQLEQRYCEIRGFSYPNPNHSPELKVKAIYDNLNITYNTNSMWLPLPMLAEKWKDKKKSVKYPVLVQPKLNGVRCIAVWENGEVVLLSRGGKKYIMPHISKALMKHFAGNPNTQFDGELYKHGTPLQYIAGIAKLEDEAQFDRKLAIQYHVYDLAMPTVKQAGRMFALSAYDLGKDYIHYVDTYTANSEQEVKEFHDKFVDQGYEGAIVRDPDATYQFGFRDQCLLKVKEFIDEEFEITGCEIDPHKGIESFVFVLKNNINDLTFKARPTGTLEEKEIWRVGNRNFIGKKATIRYQERTQDGLPHQAHVRHKDTPMLIEAIRDYE